VVEAVAGVVDDISFSIPFISERLRQAAHTDFAGASGR